MKPIQISDYEWWFMGCFIQHQKHKRIKLIYRVFKDNEAQDDVGFFGSYKEAKAACIENKVEDYKLGYKIFL